MLHSALCLLQQDTTAAKLHHWHILQASPKPEDFPALSGISAASKKSSNAAGPSGQAQSPGPSTSAAAAAADGAAAASAGVSDALKAANKARLLLPMLISDTECCCLL